MFPLLKRMRKQPSLQSFLIKQAQKIYPETKKVALVFRATEESDSKGQYRIYMTDKHRFFSVSCSNLQNIQPLDQDQFFHILINHGIPELNLPELEYF